MRTALILFSLSLAITAFSIKPIQIIKPEVLVDANGVKKHPAIWKAIKTMGFSKEQLKMMVWHGQKTLRPKHLQGRFFEEERPYFKHMKALEVYHAGNEEDGWSLIMLAGPENEHLPVEIRPIADLYMVVRKDSYVDAGPWGRLPNTSELSNGPSYKGKSRVKLLKPSNIYGSAELRIDDAAQVLLKELLSYREVAHIEIRSNEKGWPTGINNIGDRKELAEKLKKYKAYALGEFDGKMILIVPATKNKRIHRRARPIVDIYLVIDLEKS